MPGCQCKRFRDTFAEWSRRLPTECPDDDGSLTWLWFRFTRQGMLRWICVFCHQGSHHSGLGDLFGPYFVSPNVVDMSPRNMSSMGSPTYIHPLSPSPSKSKQELAVKFIIGKNQSHILEYSLFSNLTYSITSKNE